MPSLNARDIALIRLDRAHLPVLKPNQIRNAPNDEVADPRDAAFAEALYVGVIKNYLPLRKRIEVHSGRAWTSIEELTKKILLLGAHQLVNMDRVPQSVAVDRAVEQCRTFGKPNSAGMANAVLRNFLRQEVPSFDQADPELTLSFPRELYNKLVNQLGLDGAEDVCAHANREPPLTLRLFPGVTMGQLASDGVPLQAHTQAGMIIATGAKRAQIRAWAEAGLAQPQDPTAALVVGDSEISPGQVVLDRCAGMGTKTLQVQAALGGSGEVHAMDPDGRRCAVLRELAGRRGLGNVVVHQAARCAEAGALPELFDRIIADVPCSNSGVFARRAEARYHQTPRDLESLRTLQLDILDDSGPRTKVGGQLIYSTCSIYPEENRGVVDNFLGRNPQFALKSDRQTLPGGGEGHPTTYRDGGYAAVMVRNS